MPSASRSSSRARERPSSSSSHDDEQPAGVYPVGCLDTAAVFGVCLAVIAAGFVMAAPADAVAPVAGFFLILFAAHLGFYRERWASLIPGRPVGTVLGLAGVAALAGVVLLVTG